jgi:hypothetical protein
VGRQIRGKRAGHQIQEWRTEHQNQGLLLGLLPVALPFLLIPKLSHPWLKMDPGLRAPAPVLVPEVVLAEAVLAVEHQTDCSQPAVHAEHHAEHHEAAVGLHRGCILVEDTLEAGNLAADTLLGEGSHPEGNRPAEDNREELDNQDKRHKDPEDALRTALAGLRVVHLEGSRVAGTLVVLHARGLEAQQEHQKDS